MDHAQRPPRIGTPGVATVLAGSVESFPIFSGSIGPAQKTVATALNPHRTGAKSGHPAMGNIIGDPPKPAIDRIVNPVDVMGPAAGVMDPAPAHPVTIAALKGVIHPPGSVVTDTILSSPHNRITLALPTYETMPGAFAILPTDPTLHTPALCPHTVTSSILPTHNSGLTPLTLLNGKDSTLNNKRTDRL